MVKSEKCFAVLGAAFVLAFASVAGADTARDYRAASATAMRVASIHSKAGDAAHACEALSQSLESYRKAIYGVPLPGGDWRPAEFRDMDLVALGFVLGVSVLLLVVGTVTFKRLEPTFAKVL